ncbi:MAG: ExbD/TolR family protein [Bdellovibrionales bacterium]
MSSGSGQYELNLTPYIDLMSTLIVFLLMTAVWNQISVLSTDTGSTTASDAPVSDPNRINLSVTIMPAYLEMAENQVFTRIPHVDGKLDREKLGQQLKIWKKKYPNRNDVILNTENSVTYKMLIGAFDELVGNEFADVGVSTQ